MSTQPSAIFFKTIEQTIDEHRMINSKDAVLIAVSGGPDSVALVLFFLASQKKHDITIGIAHVNHMLRGDESIRDEYFVRK
ncbi:MAG: tRNA(Ile)-lysidine synthetase, partial [Desulfobacula sp.]|nr:tRNA(Ile)-lysidine synthetase [Desulfobacula sp.]